jgi:putative ABC transport system permease protein
MRLAWTLARRELRGGLSGFWVFLLCLMLGVAAIAGVGMVRSAIEAGLRDQGTILLGGDAELTLTYRFATDEERAWMAGRTVGLSEVVDFRSMAVAGEDRSLVQVKAVDDLYPLTGITELDQGSLPDALAVKDGVPGGVVEKVLADRLGLKVGDRFALGLQQFRLGAILMGRVSSCERRIWPIRA